MKKFLLSLCCVTCFVGIIIWQIFSTDTSYYLISIMILVLSMIPFVSSFERSKPTARELSLLSGLIAIAVLSRAVFYLIPQVKPIAAVVIVSGACLGARGGYLVGAFSAFISNFIFGQGVWTPFQMVALGMVGLIAGLVFKRFKPNRFLLSVVGFVSAFIVYGFIVDLSTVLMMTQDLNLSSILAVFSSGALFSLVFGIATAVFLFIFGEEFIKKINRILVKFGLYREKYYEVNYGK